jgi:hypothetical protein
MRRNGTVVFTAIASNIARKTVLHPAHAPTVDKVLSAFVDGENASIEPAHLGWSEVHPMRHLAWSVE